MTKTLISGKVEYFLFKVETKFGRCKTIFSCSCFAHHSLNRFIRPEPRTVEKSTYFIIRPVLTSFLLLEHNILFIRYLHLDETLCSASQLNNDSFVGC